jgi:hypothetical protein
MQSGLGENFLCTSYSTHGKALESTWITTLWEFMDTYKIQLRRQCISSLRFQEDYFLMSRVQRYGTSDIRKFNYCRLFLQLELFSDIVTADGAKIRYSVWHGIKNAGSIDPRDWPVQPRPSESCWKVWRSMLGQLTSANENGILQHPTTKLSGNKN